MRSFVATSSASRSTASRVIPLCSVIESHEVAVRLSTNSSNPSVFASMNARSSAVPRATSDFITPLSSAWSPPMRTCRYRSASGVPNPSIPRTSCGLRNASSPASFSGLTATIFAPARLAACSAVSIRGWFVPGFWPRIRISCDFSKSSSFTVPLPMPVVGISALPLDS